MIGVGTAGSVAGIILAAGRGRRLGLAKPLVDIAGRRAIDRVLDACRDAGVAPAIVVLGHEAEAFRAALRRDDVAFAVNDRPDSGLARSLEVGLARVPPDARAVLVWPVDVPLPDAALVRALVGAFSECEPPPPVVAPSHALRRGHPVIFARPLFAEIEALGDDDPPHRVVRAHAAEIRYVLADERCLLDIDTPEALDAVRRLAAERGW